MNSQALKNLNLIYFFFYGLIQAFSNAYNLTFYTILNLIYITTIWKFILKLFTNVDIHHLFLFPILPFEPQGPSMS